MTSPSSPWYRDAIIYELHVRSFHDSVGDGVGDFRGLTQKLDYLHDLGVTALWLLPFYPSPLKDDGYDIADYTSIHTNYGTLESFREFLAAAHARGLRVITELVLNHTSDQHPWFQRARRAPPGSTERDFYVWSDTPTRFPEARIIFQDFEASNWTYDQVAGAYYWHRFYSHQPDLNFDNPSVVDAILPIVDLWLEMGVDGVRLDAIPYLFEREGTNCENLPETHALLKKLRRHVDEKFPGRMLLAEANQWPEHAVAYFGQGDECHMAFHFPVMPRLFMAMHMGDRFPIVDIMLQTPPIPDGCQWALFLRNHDELTLEMVSDEERDYMYRAFAHDRVARVNLGIRRRLAPLLGNNRRRMELMNGLLFSLPGTPVIYYGDEIGMGDNFYLGDRNGVRTPMQWSADRNAGFSRANPQKLFLPIIIDPEYHFEAINVEAQQGNPHSLLWWMKRLIALRQQYLAFGRGDIQFLDPPNRKILAFTRSYEGETLLVVANLSRFVQFVELNLEGRAGTVPIELFGSVPFPAIGNAPYMLTLGPHSFYWFELRSPAAVESVGSPESRASAPRITVNHRWEDLFTNAGSHEFLATAGWYLRKTLGANGFEEPPRNIRIRDLVRLNWQERSAVLLILNAEFSDNGPGTLILPVAFATGDEASSWSADRNNSVIAQLEGVANGLLYDPTQQPWYSSMILDAIENRRRWTTRNGAELVAWTTSAYAPVGNLVVDPQIARVEQFDTSVRLGNHSVIKFFHRTEEGVHPEVELGRYLTEVYPTPLAAPLWGGWDYRPGRSEPMSLAVLHGFVVHEGDAWEFALDHLSNFYEKAVARRDTLPAELLNPASPPQNWWAPPENDTPEIAQELIGDLLPMVASFGQRLAELHWSLASSADNPGFRAEPFSASYQRAYYQSLRGLTLDVFHQLEESSRTLPVETRALAQEVACYEREVLDEFRRLLEHPLPSYRIRCHGDCHLGHVLFTGKDFVFIDFEGNPSRSISERRIKRSPLKDVAHILRSIDDAAFWTLYGLASDRGRSLGVIRTEDRVALRPWYFAWRSWISGAFLRSYLAKTAGSSFVPGNRDDQTRLLRSLLLEQSLTDLGQRLTKNPVAIEPLLEFLQQSVKHLESKTR